MKQQWTLVERVAEEYLISSPLESYLDDEKEEEVMEEEEE